MQVTRLRRLRRNANLRDWISQTQLSPKDIILPYFVVEGRNVKKEIKSMLGVYHFSIDNLLRDISKIKGLRSILLFGIPNAKDEIGGQAYRDDGIVQKAIRAIKREFRKLIVITDVCLCGYTTHGHCGIAIGNKILNDETIKVLAKAALSHARAGADLVAPSAMMDGQVRAIREMLDKNGFGDTGILAYSAKYASNFYGPFREALDSAPQFGDRKSYQMDYRNSNEALREIKQDIDEGADIVMVKPALVYLDIIYRAKQKFDVPIAAYNVSGEYSMIKKLAGGDKIEEKDLVFEILTSIKRAGADLIISYFGKEVLRWLV
ncbi:MAG: porphobilinogen synthase [Candidatus Omnitrophica bacterium CG07_land_8_20_14_0_80_42_15]|uniref:Delta-aminolevulinic acid dehydratase n=1 Tax=Candidatus Aquitaenariimonas noxiae TaxID=1974741 RepID=A0A2J0L581_9BACT|nr:MAG: porphobilinogen synthase [Candidatus Omnitrophica bacterium CG07_land_8_20_14_0_80_42_15]